ncbi:zinc finger MYND domain-containing protein [Sporobolomyces salmoneus]|uniref:zinc finger MYND domain-containing protein n=1 Tax=Sporobolomyces salmoneus TaxID=183962 RepID=UPI00317D6EA9
MSTERQCKACQKTADSVDPSLKFLVCSRCQSLTGSSRKTWYCSKSCQTLDWPLHKATICGLPLTSPPPPSTSSSEPKETATDLSTLDTSNLSPSLLFHLAALKTLSTSLPPPSPSTFSPSSSSSSSKELHPHPAYLFFPISPLSPSSSLSSSSSQSLPIPIHLSPPSHKLFSVLFRTAIETSGNPLSLTLMYSLLITSVTAFQGGEKRLIEQLGEEWPEVDVGKEVERDREPEEGELRDAIGGEGNFGLLVEWQVEEAERMRNER